MCNPTPFKIKIPYERGIDIIIEPDSAIDLTISQMDDFRPGKPGSEVTKSILEFEGAFLVDSDRSYDSQALEACAISLKKKEERVKEFIERNRNARIAGGAAADEVTMDEILLSAGYGKMLKEIEILKNRVKIYQDVLNKDNAKGRVKETLDPKRTCFVLQPPRQFESETSLKIFLSENPEIKEQHDQFTKQLNTEEKHVNQAR